MQCSVPAETTASAAFLAKGSGVVAGLAVADAVFAACDAQLAPEWAVRDGDAVSKGQALGTVKGNARAMLRAERVALNFLQVRLLDAPGS